MKRIIMPVLFALALAGCAGGGNKTAPNTLKFLSMDYDPVSSARQKTIVEEFNKANPDSKVEIEIVHWNDGHQKIQTLLAGNQAPDLAIVGTRWMAEYASANLLADIESLPKKGLNIAEFTPSLIEASRWKGKLVGIPCAASVRGLYYNEAMFEKAGVHPPETWDDLLRIAPAIQRANPGVNAFGIHGKEVETDLYYYYFLYGASGDILTPDGQAAFNSEAGLEALNFELGLVKDGFSQPQPTGYNREDLQNLFRAGKIAMTISGPWFAGMLKKENPDLTFGVTFIPGKTGPVVPAVEDVLVVFDSCENKDLAAKFLAFWYTDENRLAFAKDSGMLPEKPSVAASSELAADPHRRFFIEALPKGRFTPTHPKWEQMANAVCEEIQSALLGAKTPKEALDKAAERVNAAAKGN